MKQSEAMRKRGEPRMKGARMPSAQCTLGGTRPHTPCPGTVPFGLQSTFDPDKGP